MSAFEAHCKQIVDDYVQTVLIIDDGAGLKNTEEAGELIAPVADPTAVNPFAEVIQQEAPQVGEQEVQNEQITHPLNTLSLTNAFYERGIVAGLYQPKIEVGDSPEAFAEKAMKVSATADVIILDWMLIDHDARYSKEIVRQILQHDKANGGRLRTIVVYTGETDLQSLRDGLWDYLGDESLGRSTDYQINAEHLNIVFYNKVDAMHALRAVSEADLPDKALEEFAVLVDGLVPAFAMQATSTVRQNTGALLAKFSSSLDSGYLAHRALLPNPEDSETLMLENYASYLRNVLALAQVDNKSLGYASIEKWVNEKFAGCYKKAKVIVEGENNDIIFEKADFLESFKSGLNNGKDGLFKALQRRLSSSKKAKKAIKDNENIENIVGAFGKSQGAVKLSSQSLASLTSFRRTFEDQRVGMPYLTQGTIIKREEDNNYFVCVMPKCDTARVNGERKFSFAKMSENEGRYDLIIPDLDDSDSFVHLETNLKFYELENIKFSSNGGVRVNAIDDNDDIVFIDAKDKKYFWVGDLEDLDTQNKVVSIVGDFNRVGVDEVEWVRRRKAKVH